MPTIPAAPSPDHSARDPDQSPLDLRSDLTRPVVGVLSLAVLTLCCFAKELLSPSKHLPAHALSAFSAAILVLSVLLLVRRRSMGCLLRLDVAGVTLCGLRTIPWSDLSEVRHVGATKWRAEATVFVGRPGVALPPVPSVMPLLRPRRRAVRLTKRYGSPLVVPSGLTTEGATGVTAAVRRLSNVPAVAD
jgi:hypothetical protein